MIKIVYLHLISPPSFVTQYLKLLLSIKIIVVRSWMLVDMFGFNVQKERGRHVEKLEHDFEDRHYQTVAILTVIMICSYYDERWYFVLTFFFYLFDFIFCWVFSGDFDFDIYYLTFVLWENCCKKLEQTKKKKKISSNFISNGQRWAYKVMGCSCFNIESPIRL